MIVIWCLLKNGFYKDKNKKPSPMHDLTATVPKKEKRYLVKMKKFEALFFVIWHFQMKVIGLLPVAESIVIKHSQTTRPGLVKCLLISYV